MRAFDSRPGGATAPLDWLLAATAGLIAVVPFLPALGAGFVNWDDPSNLVDNPHYRGLGATQLRWMFTTTLMGHYIPLTWMSLGLNYVLGGMDPWGYHLGNLLLHAANVGLFYLVARRLLWAVAPVGDRERVLRWGALVAALVFGVHPLRVESVAWITERRDVLCGLFYLLAVLAYLRGTRDGGLLRGPWSWLSLLAFGGALLSKAITMTLPLTLLLLDVYPLRRTRLGWRALLLEKAPHAAMALAGAAVAVAAVSRGAAWTGYDSYGPTARLTMVAYSLWFYPQKLVLPTHLSPLYELPLRVDPWQPAFVWPWAGLAVVSLVLVALRRRFPAGLAAWVHSAIVLGPVSGIVHAGHQLAHDRYSYLSGLGFALLAGGAAAWPLTRRAGTPGHRLTVPITVATVLAVTGWGAAAWPQTRLWQDSLGLWATAAAAYPTCARCLDNFGDALMRTGRPEAAEVAFRAAIVLHPTLWRFHNNLGAALSAEGRLDAARAAFQRALELVPAAAEALVNLAAVDARQGHHADAIRSYRLALRLRPDYPGLAENLGLALKNLGREELQRGDRPNGLIHLREAAALLAGDPEIARLIAEARESTPMR